MTDEPQGPTEQEWEALRSLWWGLRVVWQAGFYAGWGVLALIGILAIIALAAQSLLPELGAATRIACATGVGVLGLSALGTLHLRKRLPAAMRAGGGDLRTLLRWQLIVALPQPVSAAGFMALALNATVPPVAPAVFALACAALPAAAAWLLIRHRGTLQGVLGQPLPEGSPAAERWDRWCSDLDKRLRTLFDERRESGSAPQ